MPVSKLEPRESRRSKSTSITPLGIIATFVALSETVAGLAAVKTVNPVQSIFAVFAVIFPRLHSKYLLHDIVEACLCIISTA